MILGAELTRGRGIASRRRGVRFASAVVLTGDGAWERVIGGGDGVRSSSRSVETIEAFMFNIARRRAMRSRSSDRCCTGSEPSSSSS